MTSPSDPAPPVSSGPLVAWEAPKDRPGPAPGVQFAGHGARLVAFLLDGLLVNIIPVGVLTATLDMAISRGTTGDAASSIGILLAILLNIAYFPFFWAWSGQTPGMRPFHLYVVRDRDGAPISAGRAIARLIGMWVSALALFLGFLWIFIDSRRRGWHDLIAGTVVVERRPT